MNHVTRRIVASVLIATLISLPGTLSAQGRKGADVVVTRNDWTQVSGELISVSQDSILVANPAGQGDWLKIADVRYVTIARRTKRRNGFMIGFLIGGIAGGVRGATMDKDYIPGDSRSFGILANALVIGGLGGLIGLVVSKAAARTKNLEETIQVEDLSDQAFEKMLFDLSQKARIPGVRTARQKP